MCSGLMWKLDVIDGRKVDRKVFVFGDIRNVDRVVDGDVGWRGVMKK